MDRSVNLPIVILHPWKKLVRDTGHFGVISYNYM